MKNPRFSRSSEGVACRVLRTAQAAQYLGLSSSTVEKMRVCGRGPRFLRLGGRAVGYDIRDLDAWLDAQREASSDNDPSVT